MGRLARICLTVLLTLALGVATLWLGRDSVYVREAATDWISVAIGRSLRVGDHSSVLSGSRLTLVATDVVIAQPANFPGPPFLTADRIELMLDLKQLFTSTVSQVPLVIESLSLERPTIRLQEQASGDVNWQFNANESTSAPTKVSQRPSLPLLTTNLDISALQVFLERPEQAPIALQASIRQKIEDDQVLLTVTGHLNETPMTGAFSLHPLAEVVTMERVRLEGDLRLGEVVVESRGNFIDLMAPSLPVIELSVNGPSFEYLTDRLGLERISEGPLDIQLAITPSSGTSGISVNGRLGEFAVIVTGEFDHILKPDVGNLAVSVSGPDASRIASLITTTAIPAVPFSIVTRVQRDGLSITVEDARVNVGRLQFNAAASIPNMKTPTQANLELQATIPDISIYRELLPLPIDIAGEVETSISVEATTDGSFVNATLDTDYGAYTVAGLLTNSEGLAGSALDIAGSGEDLGRVTALLELPIAPPGDWTLHVPVSVRDAGVSFSEGELHVASDSLTASGALPFDLEQGEISIEGTVDVSTLRPYLGEWLASLPIEEVVDNPVKGALMLSFQNDELSLTTETLRIGNLTAQIDTTMNVSTLNLNASLEMSSPNLAAIKGSDALLAQLPSLANKNLFNAPLSLQGVIAASPNDFALRNLELTLGELAISGTVARTGSENSVAVSGTVKSANLSALLEEALEIPALGGTITIDSAFAPAQSLVKDLIITLDEGSSLSARGTHTASDSYADTNLTLVADLVNIAHFGNFLDISLPPENLSLDVQLEGNQQHLQATRFLVSSGNSSLQGALKISNPTHPKVALTLTSPGVDVRPFTPPPVAANEGMTEVVENPVPSTADSQKSGNKKRRLIPETPIDLGFLEKFDADVVLEIGRIEGHTRDLDSVDLSATVSEGALIVNSLDLFDETSGKASIKGFAREVDGLNRFGLELASEEINIGAPIFTSDDIANLPRYDMTLALFGEGNTVQSLAANLSGGISITGGPGRIVSQATGLLTNAFFDELLSLINPLKKSDPYSQVECLTALASIDQGKVKGDPMVTFVTNKLAIIGKAQLDLSTEKIFATFNTVPQKGFGISASSAFNPFVGVAGTLADPQVTLDPEGTIVQGSLAIATGGISLIGKSVLDRMTISKKSCDKALSQFEKKRQQALEGYRQFEAATFTTFQ